MEQCKDCDLENSDAVVCAASALKNAITELNRQLPVLRHVTKEYRCPYYQRREERCKE